MSEKDRILKKAIELNKKKKYQEVNDLLTFEILQKYNDVSFYAEKALALYRLEEYESCERYANIGYKLDPNNTKINTSLGHIYSNKKDYQKAKEFYLKAIELDPNNSFTYNNLGVLYSNSEELEKAEELYLKAIKLDPNSCLVYNNLGAIYYNKREFKKAEENYLKAIEIDSNYSNPYNGLGNIYKNRKEYKKAKDYYIKSIDLNPKNSAPYYNLSNIQFENKEFEKAKENYLKKIELTNDVNEYFSKLAKSRIEEIENILESKQYEKITNISSKIKDLLRFNTGNITHYSGITIAKILILEEKEFRLSEGAFLNDTSEGIILFDYLDFDTATQNNCGPNASVFSKKPFIGSFVNQTKNNDLTLWRMYGKENLEEAKGCAITIDIEELKESIKQKLKTENDSLKDFDELEFYKVAYLDNNKFTFSESKPSQVKKLNELMEELQNGVKEFKDKANKKPHETLKIIELLNEVAYLFKNAEYRYENEVRLVMKEAIGFDKKVDTFFTPPKVYVELVSILPMIKQITIGPKVEKADEWAAAFHYHFLKKNLKPEISISNLPFK
ncbi:tetratricopeptide repeat protein [Flavobacterium sp.]|uniref:tetratricopeptide repeat protein n=1 Tax=Flavobacterium sp. TaxID=239 RepID=UPI002613DBC8|nr:tetratricopeptide repeat protein [Flavobacterium sp.]